MASTATTGPGWRLLLGFWALMSAGFVLRTLIAPGDQPLLADSDDAMRLAVVRDFLAGQPWYDLVQHRLDTPHGAEIHWSRLIDLGIGGLIVLLTPVFGAQGAETLAAYAWPLLLLFVLLYLTARLSIRLAGPEAALPGLVLPVLSAAILVEFGPGRFDHHNVQIILSLIVVLASIEALHRPRAALLAGLGAATSIAIGTEGLPIVATAILVFGLCWAFEPGRAGTMRLFGLSFAGGTLAHLAIALPPERWLVAACDAISPVYAATALGTALVFLVLPVLVPAGRGTGMRLAAGIGAGALLFAGLAIAFPHCLGGPYAEIEPWLRENWLVRVIEAKPLWASAVDLPAYTLGIAVPPLVGVVVIAVRLAHGPAEDRAAWLVLGLFLVLAVVVMLLQVRGARLAAALATPAGAWLIGVARARYLSRRRLAEMAGLVASWLAFAGLAMALAAELLLPDAGPAATPPGDLPETEQAAIATRLGCLAPEAFADLAALPGERIMAPVDLGAHVLAFTPHAVVGAPYHRNGRGMRDTFDFFNLPLDEARPILVARGISLVATCAALPEMRGFAFAAPDSFVARLATGNWPDWVVEVTPPGTTIALFTIAAE